ncbi:MAG: MEKHLA domain-containing protein [Verrucomicrobiales bacterium]|nr:MEKHLA domain-containing protein [Verrucomicrobiales bacterium]MCP5556132.1 MEKHLA domain-containing protein [Verrucomicrobiaceae bacterium]
MTETPPPFACNDTIASHCRLLRDSYLSVTGMALGDPSWAELEGDKLCAAFWNADVVIASHGLEDDPVLNYGNRRALELWEADWAAFTSMPSRLTAEPIRREERAEMLARVTADGFIDDYAGIRISTIGNRFKIHRATVWTLRDQSGIRRGQAVVFSDWSCL